MIFVLGFRKVLLEGVNLIFLGKKTIGASAKKELEKKNIFLVKGNYRMREGGRGGFPVLIG